MIFLNIVMLFTPAILACFLQNKINGSNLRGRKKARQYSGYFFMINGASCIISFIRGVKRISFSHMTVSYRIKYFLVGVGFAIIIPVFLYLLKKSMGFFEQLKNDVCRFVKDLKRYFRYAVRLAKADLRTEVANSYLDWLWWLIEPFCMMLIYAFVYGVVFQTTEEYFTAFIFIGLTVWSFFLRNTSASVSMVRSSKAIISKIYLPKYILLFSKMLVNGFKMLISFGVVIVMMIVYRVHITVNVLYLLPILIDLFLVSFAIGVVLMHYGVFVRDLPYIIDILLRMLMYLTGTFYSLAKRVPAPYGEIIEKVNPIAYLIASARDVLLYGKAISWQLLIVWTIISAIVLILGISLIYRNENSYVKVI